MQVLSIGNSFSQDAQRYLHAVAAERGEEITSVNLYIGGCSLEKHYNNLTEDLAAYDYEYNGEKTGRKISITEALGSDDWDVVTLQQVSTKSIDISTYSPYLEALAAHVREICPEATLLMHATWAYEDGSERLAALNYGRAEDMLRDASEAYVAAARLISADGIIPSGTAMMEALRLGIGMIHRDTFHASLGAGRYLLALVWYGYLTGGDVADDSFASLDEPITEDERRIVIEAARRALGRLSE